ncbi:MAG: ABC-F family ATP-binding cassette domain-containing protein [Alphaproteobacteria bacterium]
MAPPIVNLKDIRLTFGGNDLFQGVDLAIHTRDRICLVGRNGTGKSTLMKLIAGVHQADGGTYWIQPGISMAYLAQEPDFSEYETALAAAQSGIAEEEMVVEGYRAGLMLEALQVDANANPASLSGGQNRRVALAKALASNPDVLLLDEPTNHLDIGAIAWLEDELKAFRGAIILISHDRQFLKSLSNKTFWLDRGKVMTMNKGYGSFDDWSLKILEQETTEQHKLDKLIAEETQWSRQGISARRKRNMGRMRRLDDLRDQRSSQIARKGKASLEIDVGSTAGKRVLETYAISKDFAKGPLIDKFSLKIARGDKIGLVGPNGVGKSTLIKLLMDEIRPDSGTIKRGTNLEITYLDQTRSSLDPEATLWETLADVGGDQIMVRGEPRHVVSYLRDFLFDAKQARQPVGSLSGGERNRLLLAKSLASATNFLVLDEPTNDLDMDTLDLLQELLSDYQGTLLLVSHDRDFLDRVVLSTLWFEGNGKIIEYAGGYSDALDQRGLSGLDASPTDSKMLSGKKPEVKQPEKKQAAGKKMTYAQQLKLKSLPNDISKAETKIEKLQEELADPDLYTKDGAKFTKLSTDLAALQENVEEMEMEWLELEELSES